MYNSFRQICSWKDVSGMEHGLKDGQIVLRPLRRLLHPKMMRALNANHALRKEGGAYLIDFEGKHN